DLAGRRLSLVQEASRLLGAQTGRHECPQRRLVRRGNHEPGNLRPRAVHRVPWIHADAEKPEGRRMSVKSNEAPDAGVMTLSFIKLSLMKFSWRISLAVLLLTWGMHAMAAPDDKSLTAASNVVVTLDVYSGRPNPTWTLADGLPVELLRRLQGLEASKAAAR